MKLLRADLRHFKAQLMNPVCDHYRCARQSSSMMSKMLNRSKRLKLENNLGNTRIASCHAKKNTRGASQLLNVNITIITVMPVDITLF